MTETSDMIAHCHACGAAMNVASLPPFTNCACPTCGKHTRVKRKFGPYTLMRRHAVGGMSMVFGAHDDTLDREVAIKILNETYSSDERRIAAFEHEAKLTASLSHPHIVKVLTTGQAFGYFYIAMEFVSGGHLEQKIHQLGKIPEADMLPIAIEVAQGLRAAHNAGLLHRDIKPGNILLDSEGHAKLVDFGLALVTQGGKATASEIWATPYYVPPETIEGAQEDLRTDIYAFGSSLYHALAGKPPCSETSMATEALREAKRHIIPLSAANPSISTETAAVVDKAMAYLPQHRFHSYDELIAALTRAHNILLSGHHEPSDSELRRNRLLAKRNRLRLVAASIALASLTVLTIAIALIQKPRGHTGADQPPTPPTQNHIIPTDSSAADLARTYRNARTSLEKKQYRIASQTFAELLEHPKFQEPSRTMAGVEAILAAYLNGDPGAAKLHATKLRAHVRANKENTAPLTTSLTTSLAGLDKPQPIPPPDEAPLRCAQDVIAAMLAGLKNWEQGMLDPAAPCFLLAAEAVLPQEENWAAAYQIKARDYLADYHLLQSPVFAALPPNLTGCRAAMDELASIATRIKTRGRAAYNIHAWQHDIRRHAALMISQTKDMLAQSPAKPSREELLKRIAALHQAYRFTDASQPIGDLPANSDGLKRDSLLAANEAAAQFLQGMEKELSKDWVPIAISLRSGSMITAILFSQDGSATARTNEGDIPITWQDLPPDSLITLHSSLLRGSSDPTVLRRHECAIWFDWLVGNRERAHRAAEKIGQTSPDFVTRWKATLAGLSGL